MKPVLVLIAAILLCAGIVHGGAIAAQAVLGALPPATQQNGAVAEMFFTGLIFGGLLIAGLVGGVASGVDPWALGRKPLKQAGLGALLGGGGVACAAAYAWLAGTATFGQSETGGAGLLLFGTLLVLLQAGSEEVFFRGWLQPVLAERWGDLAAILVGALAFAVLHVIGGARSPVTLLNLFLGGLLFGLLAAHGRGIAAALAAHFAWNWAEQLLFGLYPNPGISSFGSVLDLELTGAPLWGGSEEGLNASLPMALTLVALLIPVLLLARAERKTANRPAAT